MHRLGNERFLLSGGLDSPTHPKAKLTCGMAVIDFPTHQCVWRKVIPAHKTFRYSCATTSLAIGVIPHAYKSDFCGVMAFGLADGEPSPRSTSVSGVVGVASLAGDDYAYATSDVGSLVISGEGQTAVACQLPHSDALCITALTPCDGTHVIATLRRTRLIDGRGTIDFVHQLRDLSGSVVWQHVSESESIVVRSDGQEVLVYADAGKGGATLVECLNKADGLVNETFVVPTSLASLAYCTATQLLFGNPRYELCSYDRRSRQIHTVASLPSQYPGWLAISVSEPDRMVLVSKVDNFLSPKTTLAGFTF